MFRQASADWITKMQVQGHGGDQTRCTRSLSLFAYTKVGIFCRRHSVAVAILVQTAGTDQYAVQLRVIFQVSCGELPTEESRGSAVLGYASIQQSSLSE